MWKDRLRISLNLELSSIWETVSKEWVHIGDITDEKRLGHREKLAKDQVVKAVVWSWIVNGAASGWA